MIRRIAEKALFQLAATYKAVAVVGPRQSGKTTLVKHLFPEKQYANLENPDMRRFASEDPRGFLAQFPNGAILDEIQRIPEIFSYLQQILDESKQTGLFILTGSNNFLLQENISQSLAGRIAYLNLMPFEYREIANLEHGDLKNMLHKGCYPPLYDQPFEASNWYTNYIRTYVERDVRQIKNISDLNIFDRFLHLCAGRTGQLLNMSNLAIETGVDQKTINSWLGILENSYILFKLQPHHANYNKRIVKMPKLYFYDSGLACALLGIREADQLSFHPLYGALFENFVIAEMMKIRFNCLHDNNLYFWRDSRGHEIDLIVDNAGSLFPIEIKSGSTITSDFFKNLSYWQSISGISKGSIIYNGESRQVRSTGIEVLPWQEIALSQANEGLRDDR
ncbi:ATP-binding protein [candidate division KSB1 bacterium]